MRLFDLIRWLLILLSRPPQTMDHTPSPQQPQRGEPAWLRLARAELGVKEAAGAQHNPVVLGYFRDAGFPEIDNDETAWCAGFVNAMLERAGYAGSKSLAARSFLNWGKTLAKPYPGCIAVFSRGDPRSWQGHVGIYVGEAAGQVRVIGGNQANEVSIADYPKANLLGYREPVTGGNSRTTRASALGIVAAGAVGTAILDSQTQLLGINAVLREIGLTNPALALGGALLQIAVFIVIIWARVDDLKTKGR
jgi:uncharacterized protein (TIGR02594 family)